MAKVLTLMRNIIMKKRAKIALVGILSCLIALPVLADLNDGLVAHYPFDGNANDESGNAHNGTEHGGVSYTAGKIGQAASFDGVDNVVTATLPEVKKTYSISLFAKFNSNNRIENQPFYLTRPNYNDRIGYLSTYPIGSRSWHFGSRRYNKGWEDRSTALKDPKGLLDHTWYHLVFMLNDNQISLYSNGILLKTIDSVHNSDIEDYGNLLLLIGGTTEKYQYMDGLIDEVRFYNRTLSESEIQELYQMGSSTPIEHDKDNQSSIASNENDLPSNLTDAVDVDSTGSQQQDTGRIAESSRAYFFKGNQYTRYNIDADKADPNYPKSTSSCCWPGSWSGSIDAAVNWGNGKVYLFKGTQYVRYSIKEDRVDSGYPRRISGNWPGLWSNGIDAAINWGNGKVYLFKGTQYVRYDIKNDRVESGYPRPISGNWPGLWSNGVDAASNWRNGKVRLPSTKKSDVVVDATTKSDPSTKKSDVVVDSTGSQQQDTGRIERRDSKLTGNTGKNPLPDLINYVFSTQKSKKLPATSTESGNCKGIINDEDRIDRLALVTLFYQNACYTSGTYNHKDYLVEQGVVTDNNNQLSFDAYKIHEPTTKASRLLASQQAIYYQFPTQEDYTIYRFEDGKIKPVLKIPASQVKTNQLTQIKKLTVSKITGSVIYLFVPSRQRVSIFTELANDVEAARVNSTPLADVLKYRYKVDGTPFDTRQDFDYGPNTHYNAYSQTRQFFLVQNHNQLGIVWQDKENASIRLTWLGKDLKSSQTIKLPNSSKADIAAVVHGEKGAIYYLTIQPGSGASNDVARTAIFYKVDESGKQLAKQELDTSKEGLNMVKFGGQNIASLQYLNQKLGLILGRKMHKSGDGLNHQGAIAVVLDANTLKVDKNWGQTSSHSFESFLTTNSNGEFVGIDLGDNYPRGVHLHKFTAAQKHSRVVYTIKTKHSSSATNNGSHYPEYSEISGGGVTYYKWSNDNQTYTELGGVIGGKSGYTVIFAGEANSEGKALDNARVGNYLNDSRNIGLVQVNSDFENASGGGNVVTDDLVRTNGITETGGFYTYGGSWSEQRNTGIVWLTHYQNKDEENVSRLKTVKLNNGQILLLWEKWTTDHYVNTYAMVISENGQKQVEPVELGTHVRLNRRDDVWVIGNQMYLIAGDKNEKKLEIIILQLK